MDTLHSTFHEIGQRPNNEDWVGVMQNTKSGVSIYVVCDGVGGLDHGQEASRLVGQTIIDVLGSIDEITPQTIRSAVHESHQRVINYGSDVPDRSDIGTTLTLAAIKGDHAYLVHAGDSRIYHIQDGEITYKSYDHTFVNDLVRDDLLSEEEAIDHPQRNVISSAIASGMKEYRLDIQEVDLVDRDHLIMVTDGVLEAIDDASLLEAVIRHDGDVDGLRDEIKVACGQVSKDNHSAAFVFLTVPQVSPTDNNQSDPPPTTKIDEKTGSWIELVQNIPRWIWLLSAFVLVVNLICWIPQEADQDDAQHESLPNESLPEVNETPDIMILDSQVQLPLYQVADTTRAILPHDKDTTE